MTAMNNSRVLVPCLRIRTACFASWAPMLNLSEANASQMNNYLASLLPSAQLLLHKEAKAFQCLMTAVSWSSKYVFKGQPLHTFLTTVLSKVYITMPTQYLKVFKVSHLLWRICVCLNDSIIVNICGWRQSKAPNIVCQHVWQCLIHSGHVIQRI